MNKFERTACCPKCGSVLLKVIPAFSKIDYICSECGEFVATVDCEEYETLNSSCEKCSNETFKVKVSENEEVENWTPYCSKCSERGASRFTDKEGRTIDAASRDVLIVRDSITKLAEQADWLESSFKDLSDTADYIEDTDDLETFNTLKLQINNCSDSVANINELVFKLSKKFNIIDNI
jgi:hypothetical protein